MCWIAVIERLGASRLQPLLLQYGDNYAKNQRHRGRNGDS